MMKGFNLLPKVARDGRIDDDRYFRVNSTSICFAYQISVFLNLSEEKYITLYRSEDGYLSFVVDVKSSVSSIISRKPHQWRNETTVPYLLL